MFKPCAVIPVYNHEQTVRAVVNGVVAHKLPCILVDDGSSRECSAALDALVVPPTCQHVTLLRHTHNRGKGEAVLTGLRHAARMGFSHALQIDADGQHCIADIPRFLEQACAHPGALIVGCPQYDHSVPPLRLYARYLTHVWVTINTLSREIKDSMCGFRVYPLAAVMALDSRLTLGSGMDFDTEVLVRLHWDGLPIVNLSTPVTYPVDGISHFRGWVDSALLARLHAALFFGMLLRLPALVSRKWTFE